jgi:hypothetical protein
VLHALRATITLMPDFGRYGAAHPGGPGRRAGSGGGRRAAVGEGAANCAEAPSECALYSTLAMAAGRSTGAGGSRVAWCMVRVRCRARERDATPLSPGGR